MQWVDFLPPILGTIWPSLRSVFRYLTGSKPRLSCCYSDHQDFLWDSAIPGEGEKDRHCGFRWESSSDIFSSGRQESVRQGAFHSSEEGRGAETTMRPLRPTGRH